MPDHCVYCGKVLRFPPDCCEEAKLKHEKYMKEEYEQDLASFYKAIKTVWPSS